MCDEIVSENCMNGGCNFTRNIFYSAAISSAIVPVLRMFLYIGAASYSYSNNVYLHNSRLDGHLELQW